MYGNTPVLTIIRVLHRPILFDPVSSDISLQQAHGTLGLEGTLNPHQTAKQPNRLKSLIPHNRPSKLGPSNYPDSNYSWFRVLVNHKRKTFDWNWNRNWNCFKHSYILD
ncbi:hypothetical protein QC760_009687 [Botrytis cinerea]